MAPIYEGLQTTTLASNAIVTAYVADYMEAAQEEKLYDQLALPVANGFPTAPLPATVTVNFMGSLEPATSALPETTDITPQYLKDATATISPVSRGQTVQLTELLKLETYLPYEAEHYKKLGESMMRSIDLLAQSAAISGTYDYSYAARASLDAGTAAHRLNQAAFNIAESRLMNARVPGFMTGVGKNWAAIIHPDAFVDLRNDTYILAVGEYQKAEIILNNELGSLGRFRIAVSPFAKVFGAAGADNGTAIATTLSAAADSLDLTIDVASAASMAEGMKLVIGTEETASTYYPTNEEVRVASISGTTVTIIGSGENGGLKWPHASGAAVRNADNVYPCVFGGPGSLAKVYASSVGEFGQVVGPITVDSLQRLPTLGWKWYGNYSRLKENGIFRIEVASSLEA